MMIEAINQIIEDIENTIPRDIGEPCFTNRDYQSIPFDIKNYHYFDQHQSKRKIAFIDGGSQKILEIPTLSVQFNRAYFNIYDSASKSFLRDKSKYLEFISITKATLIDDYPHYKTTICNNLGDFDCYYPKESDLEFDPRRESAINDQIFDIGRVSPIARRFAEWTLAMFAIDNFLEEGDVVVMDGTLKASFPNETKFAKKCYDRSLSKKVAFTGLAKSSRLFTTSGISLTGAVLEMAKRNKLSDTWFYNPVAKSLSPTHAAELYIVKLHPMSDRVFRFDLQSEHAKLIEKESLIDIMSILSINSSDPSFLGYPYGLIDADQNARVRGDEIEIYRNHILSKASEMNCWDRFKREMNSLDAHDILNIIG